MRTKSEARREAILKIAMEVFREVGFDAASMSQIAARVGGSKATLYNYFPSKDALLLEALVASANAQADAILELLRTSEGLRQQLHEFVASLLDVLNADDTIEVIRVAISVGGTTDVGRQFYEHGTRYVWEHITELLRAEIQNGALRDADPHSMAMHLRCLCEHDMMRNLLGAGKRVSKAEHRKTADVIVDAFLRIYAADTTAI